MSQDAVLAVRLLPGVRPLTDVVSVLHARAADIAALDYIRHAGEASLTVRCSLTDTEANLLARQLDRRIDVLSASVQQRPGSAATVVAPSC